METLPFAKFYSIPRVIQGIEKSTTAERDEVIDKSAIAKSAPPSSTGAKTSPIIPFQLPEPGGSSPPYYTGCNINFDESVAFNY